MRLIDADKLIPSWMNDDDGAPITGAVLLDDILNAPTIDAVEVVRCKNCLKRGTDMCHMKFTEDDAFCSFGDELSKEFDSAEEMFEDVRGDDSFNHEMKFDKEESRWLLDFIGSEEKV